MLKILLTLFFVILKYNHQAISRLSQLKQKIMKKILFLSSWYPNRTHTTLGNFNEKFAQAANIYNKVFAIHVAADENMTENFEIVEENRGGVETLILYFRKIKNENVFDKMIKSFKFLFYYFKLFKVFKVKNGKPDLIHLNILYPVGIVVFLFKLLYKTKYVISENWTIYLETDKNNPSLLANLISPLIARKSSCLLPVSLDLKNAMIKHNLISDFEIVPNVVETKFFKPNYSKILNSKKQILHVSSLLDDHKNITGILNVIKRVSEIRQDFELFIVGDGDSSPHIKLSRDLGLIDKFVSFYGQKNPIEISELMYESDFLLLFSNYENLPCVIVEALSSGLPIVSSDVGGISEHIDKEKGILVDARNENQLFDALIMMLDCCNNYDKSKLHDYAVSNFSYESIGQRLTDIYNNILKIN